MNIKVSQDSNVITGVCKEQVFEHKTNGEGHRCWGWDKPHDSNGWKNRVKVSARKSPLEKVSVLSGWQLTEQQKRDKKMLGNGR